MGVRGCCRLLVAAVVVPFAAYLAAILEKPVVATFPIEGVADTGAAAAAAEASSKTAATEDSTVTSKMGGGKMFDRIAFAYDSTNKWMSLGLDKYWRKMLVEECMRLQPEDQVLDLATGTADVSLLVASRLKDLGGVPQAAGHSVLGIDPSGEMLRRGVSKVEDTGFKEVVRLTKGDAQDLSTVRDIDAAGTLSEQSAGVSSESIDKISMSFGIRNVPDRLKALREMKRVLRKRPTSRVCILEFSLPTGETFLSKVAYGFIKHVVPFIGKLATRGSGSEEYQYLEKSILEFPAPTDFAAQMGSAGLPVFSITSFAYGAVHLYAAVPAGVGPPA
eukprot:gnl/TRDRNA2_/TRDRNA2_187659_c0_seq1.p1 gnl/TRDRNA2_/TRDRNA2_187659_c0~~gnl/TRDRNA2_/TRDRNA2_187659_c0_seq1.p1  ORF type:complete len:333 (-),score=76.31 gnl/TRDRNA2_/TRDRNA2_187659_c0_seq1:125-1123(-)